jgi:predicted naringenin-chalcone synthase
MQPGAIGLTALLLGALALFPLSAVYAQAEKQQQVEKKKQGSANRECRRIKETGSRIAKRVCKKPEQWAREEQIARENIEQSREGANRNTGVSGQQ